MIIIIITNPTNNKLAFFFEDSFFTCNFNYWAIFYNKERIKKIQIISEKHGEFSKRR